MEQHLGGALSRPTLSVAIRTTVLFRDSKNGGQMIRKKSFERKASIVRIGTPGAMLPPGIMVDGMDLSKALGATGQYQDPKDLWRDPLPQNQGVAKRYAV